MISMDVSLRNLEMVNVIVKEGSLTKAAEKLFLSQPAISHQLKKLENQIGLKVFNRVNKKLILTEAGQILFEASEKILISFSKVKTQLENIKNEGKSNIRLSTECYTCYHWLPKATQKFRKQHEHIHIQIVIEATQKPLQYLTEGKIDLAIVSSIQDHPAIHYHPLIEDEMVVIVSKEHPFAQRKTLTISDFKDQNLLLYDLPDEKNYILSHILNNNTELARSIQKVQLTEAIIELVRANLGVSVMARWAVNAYAENATLVLVPFQSNKGKRTWRNNFV